MNTLLKLITFSLVIATFSIPSAIADNPIPVSDTAKQMLGRWKIVKGVNQGERMTVQEMQDLMVVVKQSMIITLDQDANEKYRAEFEIDETKTPIHIDMVSGGPAPRAAKSLGIVEITDDGWKICYALPGSPRPSKFESTKKNHALLFVHEKPRTTIASK